jgi:hypothetical protein
MRRSYHRSTLDEASIDTDPFVLFGHWLKEAEVQASLPCLFSSSGFTDLLSRKKSENRMPCVSPHAHLMVSLSLSASASDLIYL